MKYFLLIFITICLAQKVQAQTSQTEAKAAYLLAEESYGKGDHKTALDFLQQVKSNLGASNCKILYLEIMITRELYSTLPDGGEKVLALISLFENSSDYTSFSEDKVLEVAKLKLALKADLKILKEKTDKENATAAALEKAFNDEFSRSGPWNVSREELDSIRPELKVKDWKPIDKTDAFAAPGFIYDPKTGKRTGFNWAIEKGFDYKGKISNIGFSKKNTVHSYQTFLVYSDAKEDGGNLLTEALNIVKEYTQKLGFAPVMTNWGTYTLYEWKRAERRITLELIYQPGKSTVVGPVQLIESVINQIIFK